MQALLLQAVRRSVGCALLMRWWCRTDVNVKQPPRVGCMCLCRGVLTQHQMDKLYAGPRWEIDVRYTFVMNTVMVALFFCGGLPILLPLTTASIAITFMLDKWLRECPLSRLRAAPACAGQQWQLV